MNELQLSKRNILFYKKYTSHFILERGTQCVVSFDGKTYTLRRDFFLPRIFFLEPGGANAFTPLQAVSSEKT